MPDLEARLAALPAMPHPASAGDILAEARRRRRARRRAGAGITLLAAAALAVVLLQPSGDPTRVRGSPVLPSLALKAAAEGSGAPRALVDGALLGPGEAVVFRIASDAPGLLTLTADGAQVATWSIEPGEHFVGGGGPLAWTPDGDAAGDHEVVATLCTAPGRCTSTSFRVRWAR